MFWLSRPPYLRWMAAVLVVVAAGAWELRPRPQVSHPFAATDLPAGTVLSADSFERRLVPAGLLPVVEPTGTLLHALEDGEPLLPSHLAGVAIPEGWWAVEVPVPAGATPGMLVKVVVVSSDGRPPLTSDGVVSSVGSTDSLNENLALVAVPADNAEAIASAALVGELAVLFTGDRVASAAGVGRPDLGTDSGNN